MSRGTVLVVEDESDVREMIQYNLEQEGYETRTTGNGDEALDLLRENELDLVVLDVMLPGRDGVEICKDIRANSETQDIPVIMVTARDKESDVILGLGVGADDYVTKPFRPRELIARIKAVLRRVRQSRSDGDGPISRGRLTIDPPRHRVEYDGDVVDLTATEFRLLRFLATHPGRVFTREQLLSQIAEDRTYLSERNVDVHVRRIRQKLDAERDLIETVRGVGYRFREDVE